MFSLFFLMTALGNLDQQGYVLKTAKVLLLNLIADKYIRLKLTDLALMQHAVCKVTCNLIVKYTYRSGKYSNSLQLVVEFKYKMAEKGRTLVNKMQYLSRCT